MPEIILLSPADWQEFKELRLESLQTDPTAFGGNFEDEVKLTESEWRLKLAAPSVVYGIKMGGQLVGTGKYRVESGRNFQHIADIYTVFIKPEFRRQGLALALLKKILEDLHANPQILKVQLTVNTSQEAAVSLYKSLGFKIVGTMEKDLKIGSQFYDEYQMELIFRDKI